MNHYQLIASKADLAGFVDEVLPAPEGQERDYLVYFLSMSARNKYLSDEQREEIHLGRTEMFNRKGVYVPEDMTPGEAVYRTVRRMQVPEGAYFNKSGTHPLPVIPYVFTIYMNLDLANTLEAWNATANQMNATITDRALDRNVRIPNPESVYRTELQRSKKKKTLVDTDVDVPFLTEKERYRLALAMFDALQKHSNQSHMSLKGWMVRTTSGFHLLLLKDGIRHDFMTTIRNVVFEERLFSGLPEPFSTPERGCLTMDEVCNHRLALLEGNSVAISFANGRDVRPHKVYPYDPSLCKWEVEPNKNRMLPLPGTYQPTHHRLVKQGHPPKFVVTYEQLHE